MAGNQQVATAFRASVSVWREGVWSSKPESCSVFAQVSETD